jgi:hypothetical protein
MKRHLLDLLTASLAMMAAAAIAEALTRPPVILTMPDGSRVRADLTEADVAALLGGGV